MADVKHVQHLRGSSAQNDAYTGLEGELTVDLTNNRVRVHDGLVTGGVPLAKLAEALLLNSGNSVSVSDWVQRTNSAGYIRISGGGSYSTGGNLVLYGETAGTRPGYVRLVAHDGNSSSVLDISPAGSFTFKSVEVERTHNNSGKYIKLESGVLVCWGIAQVTSTGTAITFGESFKDNNEPVVFTCAQNTATTSSYSSRTASGFTLKANSSSNVWVSWLAIGRWK